MKFATKAIAATIKPDPTTGSVINPIYQTSTYKQDAPGVHKGYEYARTQNPTRHLLEEAIARIESGKFGLCFGSGMAAVDTVIKLLQPGDEVISTNDLYGGSFRIFDKVFSNYGIKFHFTDMTNPDNVATLINDKTRMIWVETPTNPMLNIIDLQAMAALAKDKNIITVCDNTFASPYLQRPLEHGVDIVLHSATKYLGGHSDVVLGAVATSDEAIADKLYFLQNTCGAVCGPFDVFLVIRGIKTLHLRMRQHSENARQIALFLNEHDKVKDVYWPGFANHPNHNIAARQMDDFGGMVSFSLKDDSINAANTVLSNTNLFVLAESLGGVESLIGHPATMTHASIPLEKRIETGVVDSLIRLSVGIEDADDLKEDLGHALKHVR